MPRKVPLKRPPKRRSRRRTYISRENPTIVNDKNRLVMRLPRKMRSLNKIKSGIARHGDTQAWERLIRKAEILGDGTFSPATCERIRVQYERQAPSKHWMLDPENTYTKGLTDALVRLGYLVDDNPKWVEIPPVIQSVSSDKKFWTIVTLTHVE